MRPSVESEFSRGRIVLVARDSFLLHQHEDLWLWNYFPVLMETCIFFIAV